MVLRLPTLRPGSHEDDRSPIVAHVNDRRDDPRWLAPGVACRAGAAYALGTGFPALGAIHGADAAA